MMPLTAQQPKPMVTVRGKPMIGHILDHLKAAGVTHVTVNGHYKPDPLEAYLNTREDLNLTFIRETKALETGGGLINGLHTMPDDAPFYIINGDAFWFNPHNGNSLLNLAAKWDSTQMELLLLLQDKDSMPGNSGKGDYAIAPNGQAQRNLNRNGSHMFAGIRICDKRIFDGESLRKFSFLELMDKAQSNGHLFGHDHTGQWHHLSTPEDITALETIHSRESNEAHG